MSNERLPNNTFIPPDGQARSARPPAGECARWADKVELQTTEEPVVLGVGADPEPSDLVAFPEPEGAVSRRDRNRIERLAGVNLLELQAWVLGVPAKESVRLASRFFDLSWQVRDTTPRSAASHAISQLVGVEFRRSARSEVSPHLSRELAQIVL